MARVTVEDCIRLVQNRFELVLISAARSRQLASGQGRSILVDRENDRNPVVALREIAEGKITPEELHHKIISDSFRHSTPEETSAENVDMSEEDMLKQLEAENREVDFNLNEDEDEDSLSAKDLDNLEGLDEIADQIDSTESTEGEIGKAADDEFVPSEAQGEEESLMADIEIDEETIGEAIEDDAAIGEAIGEPLEGEPLEGEPLEGVAIEEDDEIFPEGEEKK